METGTKFLQDRGLKVVEIIESSQSTSATLLALPRNYNPNLFGMNGALVDIFLNLILVQLTGNTDTPPTKERAKTNNTSEGEEEPTEAIGSIHEDSINLDIEDSELGTQSTRSSTSGNASRGTNSRGRVARRLTAREYKVNLTQCATTGSSRAQPRPWYTFNLILFQ